MRRRKARTRRLRIGNRDNGCGKNQLVERKVERIGRLCGEFGIAVAARDIAERELGEPGVGVDGRLRLFFGGRGLLFALGFHDGFVFRGQDFRAVQVFVGVNVFLLLRLLLFTGALLARGCGYILRILSAALRSAEK